MGWLQDIWIERQKDWIITSLLPSNTPDKIPQVSLRPNKDYVSIDLASLRIVKVRTGWSKFYGVVHSRVALAYLDNKATAEFNTVTVPAMLKDVDAKALDRILQINKPLAGPVPYRGGRLELQIGLFSVKSKDLAGPFISILEDLSKQAGVAYVSQAVPFVGPIKRGVELLTGQGADIEAHVGLDRADAPPISGWYAVIADDKSTSRIKPNELKVDANDLRLLDGTGKPIQNVPYFVYVVRASAQRSDWHQVPELGSLYTELRVRIGKGEVKEAKDVLATLRRYYHTSPDLLSDDAAQIYDEIKQRANQAFPAAIATAGEGVDIGDLETLDIY